MQTSPTNSTLASSLVNSAVALSTSANSPVIFPAAHQQGNTTAIELMALPSEILAFIMRKVDNPLLLSTCCHHLRAIYQDKSIYEAHKRQSHSLMHNMLLPSANLRKSLSHLATEDKICLPEPEAPTWHALRDQVFTRQSPLKERVKKTYLIAWEALLTLNIPENRLQASELMRLLLELAPYVNAEQYVLKLFAGGFPWGFFDQLASVHLDRCLRLVARYFSAAKNSPASEFLWVQCPLLAKLSGRAAYSLTQDTSLLFFALKHFVMKSHLGPEHIQATCEELLRDLFIRGCDLEQMNKEGDTALLYILHQAGMEEDEDGRQYCADKEQLCKVVPLLLAEGADCHAVSKSGDNALTYAIQTRCLSVIKKVLSHLQGDSSAFIHSEVAALYVAIEQDELPKVMQLISDPSIYAFLYALWRRQDEQVDERVQIFLQGKTAQEKSQFLESALSWAVEECSVEEFQVLVPLLLRYGADCNSASGYGGETALQRACDNRQEDLVKLLLQQPTIHVNMINVGCTSVLESAIFSNNLTILRALLAHPDINVEYGYSGPPLEAAIDGASSGAVTLLVQALFNKNLAGTLDSEILHHKKITLFDPFVQIWGERCRGNKEEVAKAFLQGVPEGQREVFLHAVLARVIAQAGYLKSVWPEADAMLTGAITFLLAQGADCNIADEKGNTALITACHCQQEKLVALLLQQPTINVNAQNCDQFTALDYVMANNNIPILTALITHNTVSPKLFICAFLETICSKKTAMRQVFLHYIKAFKKQRLLNHALNFALFPYYHSTSYELIAFLLRQGAQCNAFDHKGNTVLINACRHQQEKVVSLLLQQPTIDLNLTNHQQMSALHYAIKKGNTAIVQALLDTNKIARPIQIAAFNYALSQGQDDIAGIILAMAEEAYLEFIEQAIILANSQGQADIVKILKAWPINAMQVA
jgi:ankyrin repeat protein